MCRGGWALPARRVSSFLKPTLHSGFLFIRNMEKERPAYYANIPASVRYDESLSPNAKLLYGEITALCNKEGYCWASNRYFAELYKVAPGTISEWVRLLVDAGHISYKVENKNSRRIFLKGVSGNPEGGIRKSRRGVSGNPELNITVNNTKNITTNSDASRVEESSSLIVAIIDAFVEWNPAARRCYGIPPQRKACESLLEHYGLERTLAAVTYVREKRGADFMPTITTPLQLWEKWAALETAANRAKSKKGLTIAAL